jgi:16S rRNA (uracil1498-N3)-methyltransferase
MDAKIRLYVDQPLGAGQAVAIGPDQATYLFAVMRLPVGSAVLLFNGQDGEWLARVQDASKRRGVLLCDTPTRPQGTVPDLWLVFSPVRKERTQFIVEKAVELGVARLVPATMRRTSSDRWRADKHLAHAIEAAEQCGATCLPALDDIRPLDKVLADWPADRALFWADEALAGAAPAPAFSTPAAILVGPEGGFAPDEQAALRALPFVRRVSLGPRILRAETAALAALVLWQAGAGDWQ